MLGNIDNDPYDDDNRMDMQILYFISAFFMAVL
jgi:hypothetical protein